MITALFLAVVVLLVLGFGIAVIISGIDEHGDTHEYKPYSMSPEIKNTGSGKCRKNRTRRNSRQANINGAWRSK